MRKRLGLEMLVKEGHDPNHVSEHGYQPLSYVYLASMVDALIAVGAEVELLNGTIVPKIHALRRMLQLCPQQTKAVFGSDVLLTQSLIPAILCAKLMREYDYPPPCPLILDSSSGDIAWALFNFKYTNRRPVFTRANFIFWRSHTHYASPQKVKDQVLTTLLCFKRVVPRLPRDMRILLLNCTFGEDYFYCVSPKALDADVNPNET